MHHRCVAFFSAIHFYSAAAAHILNCMLFSPPPPSLPSPSSCAALSFSSLSWRFTRFLPFVAPLCTTEKSELKIEGKLVLLK